MREQCISQPQLGRAALRCALFLRVSVTAALIVLCVSSVVLLMRHLPALDRILMAVLSLCFIFD
jgi:hypothetical protein